MKTANPYLIFDGNAEEAFNFYRSVFGGEFAVVVRFGDFGDKEKQVPNDQLDRIAHIALPLGPDNLLMASDHAAGSAPPVTVGNNFYIALETDSDADVERLFGALCADGSIEMPLGATEWAEKFGMCTDRFGVQWMLSHTGSVEFGVGQEGSGAATG